MNSRSKMIEYFTKPYFEGQETINVHSWSPDGK